jgi:hypothetical protein
MWQCEIKIMQTVFGDVSVKQMHTIENGPIIQLPIRNPQALPDCAKQSGEINRIEFT